MQRQIALRTRGRKVVHSATPSAAPLQGASPDIETSSAGYARRFSGPAGRYLLRVQSDSIARVLRDLPPGRALDVGGGHGQLVPLLRSLGWEVTVHGTDAACERNLRELHGRHDCGFLLGGLFDLPAADRSFDLVIAVRLISHVGEWERLVAGLCRVARHAVVIDYPNSGGLNALTPLLFGLKKSLEGNTRTYTSFSRRQLVQAFESHGFGRPHQVKQFFLPMVVHRMGKGSPPLRALEKLCRWTGLTALAGSPVILRVDRKDTAGPERG
jgi:2-polyprenyl-3-methyl-5-hydroxy-6-metoxy-1,4-benzoquinol methylase